MSGWTHVHLYFIAPSDVAAVLFNDNSLPIWRMFPNVLPICYARHLLKLKLNPHNLEIGNINSIAKTNE